MGLFNAHPNQFAAKIWTNASFPQALERMQLAEEALQQQRQQLQDAANGFGGNVDS